jgi:hypothetical protein
MLRKAEFTHGSILKYLHANSLCVDYLLQLKLSIEDRMALEQTKHWYKNMKKPRSKAMHKEVRSRNCLESMKEDGMWLDVGILNGIQQSVDAKADELVAKAVQFKPTLEDCIEFRHYLVFTMYQQGKICRYVDSSLPCATC